MSVLEKQLSERRHGGPIEAPRTSQHYRIEGFRGIFNCVPIMPRKASFLDSDRE